MKKGSKIVIQVSISVADTFGDFITSRKAKGLSEKTLTTYKQHLSAIGKHLDVAIPIEIRTFQKLYVIQVLSYRGAYPIIRLTPTY